MSERAHIKMQGKLINHQLLIPLTKVVGIHSYNLEDISKTQRTETSSLRAAFVRWKLHARHALAHPQTTQTHRGVSASSAKGTYRDTQTLLQSTA